MATVTASVHRLSVEDVYRMVEAGVIDKHDRVELVEGGSSTWRRSERTARRSG